MNTSELAKRIAIDPRAFVLTGALRERVKNSDAGQISGFTPHYTIRGCPPAEYTTAGDFVPSHQEACAIEADFIEKDDRPEIAAIRSAYGRPLNMVHLVFGQAGRAPNNAEAKVLREAGEIFKQATGRTAFLAVMPVLSSAAYGVASGRLYALGLFRDTGEALWLNPLVAGKLIKAEYPTNQLQRSVSPTPAVAVHEAPKVNWYELLKNSLAKSTKMTGAKLHNLILGTYADQLLIGGRAADKAAALEIAKREYEGLTKPQEIVVQPAQPAPAAKLSKARV